ncbi:hypothetical protein BVRB_6g133180 [Beta vulgaris subsp. vulgaris]|nr:hypothetical protein BVRB_6g133180 [Beta vulgaris subsp. vulgaris]
MMSGEPNYYLSMINNHDEKKKSVSGLDKRALKTFPVVKFSKDVQIQGLGSECVICLSDFKVGEKVRILPKCNHGFHVKCIDEWLSSHSSCPICRQSLVETCQKIIGCDHDHHTTTSSSTSPSSSSSSLISSSSSRDVVVRKSYDPIVLNDSGCFISAPVPFSYSKKAEKGGKGQSTIASVRFCAWTSNNLSFNHVNDPTLLVDRESKYIYQQITKCYGSYI